ncbi:MAG TPA: ABC transporter permease [Thermoanaerobaculia bacterium]|nr:ABC transporter permease [Thermoanaerobaculia bacterium]HUM29497.1 ABC transporter permease [Thermoanaerobaculia bacterium]HXK67880.1 ABC transporter permease [Thermoanaerobaculia bacterium]
MRTRLLLTIPLILTIVRFGTLRSMTGTGEMTILFILAVLAPFLPLSRILRTRSTKKTRIGAVLLLLLLMIAIFAPVIALHPPNETYSLPECRYLSPLSFHTEENVKTFFPLGTDDFGRCVYSRLVYGSRVSLSIGILAMIIAVGLGAFWGATAGYLGGWADGVMMRIVDGLMAFPRLFLLILIVAVWPTQPSVLMVILVLGFLSWMEVSRLVRGQILSLKERDFILAARQMGASHFHILIRHLLPNASGPVMVDGTLRIGGTILVEAALSFLGLGVQPPTASWGNMIAGGQDALLDAWWMTTFPGLAIVVTVMSFFLLGEGFRDATQEDH